MKGIETLKALIDGGTISLFDDTYKLDENGLLLNSKMGEKKYSESILNFNTITKHNFELVESAHFSFSDALYSLKSGRKVSRDGWNGKGQYIEMHITNHKSKMTRPYLYIKTVDGDLVPWVASQTDLLADDWYEVE